MLAGDGADDMLFRFAAGGEPLIAAIEPLLRAPGLRARRLGSALLSVAQRVADKGMMKATTSPIARGHEQAKRLFPV